MLQRMTAFRKRRSWFPVCQSERSEESVSLRFLPCAAGSPFRAIVCFANADERCSSLHVRFSACVILPYPEQNRRGSEESVPVRRRRVRRPRRTANAEQSVPPGRRGRRPLRNVGIVAHAVHRYDGVGARRRFRVFSISFLQSDWKYDMISLRRNQILSLKVCVLTSFGKNTRFGFMYLR